MFFGRAEGEEGVHAVQGGGDLGVALEVVVELGVHVAREEELGVEEDLPARGGTHEAEQAWGVGDDIGCAGFEHWGDGMLGAGALDGLHEALPRGFGGGQEERVARVAPAGAHDDGGGTAWEVRAQPRVEGGLGVGLECVDGAAEHAGGGGGGVGWFGVEHRDTERGSKMRRRRRDEVGVLVSEAALRGR